jgi:hypothetical protein
MSLAERTPHSIRERGAPIWVTAPAKRELERLRGERMAALGRIVTMGEVIELLLAERKAATS